MIHGMKTVYAVSLLLLCLANPPRARATVDLSLGPQSTPKLKVRVYGFPGLSAWMLQRSGNGSRARVAPRTYGTGMGRLYFPGAVRPLRVAPDACRPGCAIPSQGSAAGERACAWDRRLIGRPRNRVCLLRSGGGTANTHPIPSLDARTGNDPRDHSSSVARTKAFGSGLNE